MERASQQQSGKIFKICSHIDVSSGITSRESPDEPYRPWPLLEIAKRSAAGVSASFGEA